MHPGHAKYPIAIPHVCIVWGTMDANSTAADADALVKHGLNATELVFVQTCEQELMNASSRDGDGLSQVSFSAFVTSYCRGLSMDSDDDDDLVTRGSACNEAMLLFQDLPWTMQVEFAKDMTDQRCFAVSNQPVQLLLCVNELNAEGELFYVGTDAIPNLCSSLFDTMILTELVAVSGIRPTPTASPSDDSPPPAASPWQEPFPTTSSTASIPTMSTTMDVNQTDPTILLKDKTSGNGDLSLVLGLGIAMCSIFVLALAAHLLYQIKTRKKKQTFNDAVLLQDNESMSSENSHDFSDVEAHSVLNEIAFPDDCSVASSTGSWFGRSTTSKSTTTASIESSKSGRKAAMLRVKPNTRSHSVGSLGRQQRPQTPRDRYSSAEVLGQEAVRKTPKRRSSFPQSPLTETLSDDNPMHIRKRFAHRRGGSFTFDETDVPNRRDVTTSADEQPLLPPYRATPSLSICTTATTLNKENAANAPDDATASRTNDKESTTTTTRPLVLGQRKDNSDAHLPPIFRRIDSTLN